MRRQPHESSATYYDDVVAIVGARAHPNLDMVRAYVRSLPRPHIVVTGGAVGVDKAAMDEAYEWTIYERMDEGAICRTSWGASGGIFAFNQYALGRAEQLLFRNTLIAAQCKRMVVFPDGSRGGCWDAARQAKRFRKPVEVRWCDGRVEKFA